MKSIGTTHPLVGRGLIAGMLLGEFTAHLGGENFLVRPYRMGASAFAPQAERVVPLSALMDTELQPEGQVRAEIYDSFEAACATFRRLFGAGVGSLPSSALLPRAG